MPIMTLNLRPKPNGLETYKQFIKEGVESWLADKHGEADVMFICSSVDSETTKTVKLAAHQAVLAPVSELLRDLFLLQNCGHTCHSRNMVHISLECDPQVLQSVLCLVYNGQTLYTNVNNVKKMQSVVNLLKFKLPGGFKRIQLPEGQAPSTSTLFQVSGQAPLLKEALKRSAEKRPMEKRPSSSTPSPSPVAKKPREDPSPAPLSATDRMKCHVSMTLELKDAPPKKSIPCKMPRCGALVNYEQLSSHFLAHETSAGAVSIQGGSLPTSFPCVACGVTFQSRRELDTHTKTKHGAGAGSVREKLNLLSDSSDDDSFDRVSETTSVKSAKAKEKPRCSKCDSVFPTILHLKSHTCNRNEDGNKCDTCFKSFKTNKALQVHMKSSHKGTSLDPKKDKGSPSKKYPCQICTKSFAEFRMLRTHYTLYHFWDNLEEDYKEWNDVCKICSKKYPTSDHLLQHVGNFHCKIDQYLVKKGLRIVSKEKTAKLRSLMCEICKMNQVSSAALKSHMAVKHFQKELLAEFPISRQAKSKKCPKCFKLFENTSVSTVVAHVGSFHDEVIKYASPHLDLEAADIENIPTDDFDDGTVGVSVNLEETKQKSLSSPKTKKLASFGDVFDYLQCQFCYQTFNNSNSLKVHYILHFPAQFKDQYFVSTCPHCKQNFPDIYSTQKHVATDHSEMSLLPLMESHGLWVNKSVILPADSAKIKNIRIDVKKLNKRMIGTKLDEIEDEKLPLVPEKQTCIFPRCGKVYDSKEDLLRHLVISHFWKELTIQYGPSFDSNPKNCPVCKQDNKTGERSHYFFHLAIEHDALKTYIEKSEKEAKEQPQIPKLVSRMNPAASQSASTSNPLPILNFSNESISSEDEKIPEAVNGNGNGAGAATLVKSEKTVTEDDSIKPSKNEELLSKIRNVFSDSDSD